MLKIPAADQFGGNEQHSGPVDAARVDQRNEEHRLHRLPSARPALDRARSRWHSARLRRRRMPGVDGCKSGQAGQLMIGQVTGLGDVAFANYGDWTDRVAKGELPFAKPPRPQGVERNIVVTLRDWMNDKQYLHDLIASDRRTPTVNANGPTDRLARIQLGRHPILDPVKNVATTFKAPVRDPEHATQPRSWSCRDARCVAAVALLGQRADLGNPREQPQLDVRP